MNELLEVAAALAPVAVAIGSGAAEEMGAEVYRLSTGILGRIGFGTRSTDVAEVAGELQPALEGAMRARVISRADMLLFLAAVETEASGPPQVIRNVAIDVDGSVVIQGSTITAKTVKFPAPDER